MSNSRKTTNEVENESDNIHGDAPQPPEDSGIHESTPEVPVSHSFQTAAHHLISKGNEHHMAHIRQRLSMREAQLAEEKASKQDEKPQANGKSDEFVDDVTNG